MCMQKQGLVQTPAECSLGSEGEDEGCVWGTDVKDERHEHDKLSLTASEGTEAGSPARSTRGHSLSPSLEHWDETENTTLPSTTGDTEPSMY
ncbi:zinc finger E-box-binding homeobox 2-like isoform X1, partial [Tachysurus ichikawai]